MSIKRSLLALGPLLTLAAISAESAVTVSSVAGTFSTGSTFTVVGTNFQTKSPAAPYLFAPFNSSAAADTTHGLHDFNALNALSYNSSEGYSGGCLKASDGLGNWTARLDFSYYTTHNQRIYVFRMVKQNFLVTTASQNWKTIRWWPSGVNYPNLYTSATNGICNIEDASGTGFYANFNTNSTNWVAEEFNFQANSAIDVKDGSMVYRANGVTKASGSLKTRYTARPDYMSRGYILHGVLANQGSWSPAWSTSNRIWYDNVYMDTTWARVMIGNASTYAACTNLQPQPPTAWSTTNITVYGNFTGFSNGVTVYVYVVDKDGNVNTNGYAVVVAGSGGSPAPTFTSINYSTGLYTGGTSEQATGTGFAGSVSVMVGTTAATGVSLISSTKINFIIPAGAIGATPDITITNGDGQNVTLAGAFTYGGYPSPTLTSIDYTTGTYSGGTGNVARGTNFLATVQVYVGTTAATNVSLISATRINFTMPGGPPSTIQFVKVINGDAQEANLPNAFTYGGIPTVFSFTSITPGSGSSIGGTSVRATGVGFSGAVSVKVAGVSATAVILTGSTRIDFVTPAGTAGTAADVTVFNGDTSSLTISSTFTYVAPPAVTSFDYSTGPYSGGTGNVARGTGFTGSPQVFIGTTSATNINRISSTQINFTMPGGAPSTIQQGQVINPDGQAGSLYNAFIYSDVVPVGAVRSILMWK